eukprot:scaffold7949_cov1690-Pinguiococcus_pyrenoidosus.AAC.1
MEIDNITVASFFRACAFVQRFPNLGYRSVGDSFLASPSPRLNADSPQVMSYKKAANACEGVESYRLLSDLARAKVEKHIGSTTYGQGHVARVLEMLARVEQNMESLRLQSFIDDTLPTMAQSATRPSSHTSRSSGPRPTIGRRISGLQTFFDSLGWFHRDSIQYTQDKAGSLRETVYYSCRLCPKGDKLKVKGKNVPCDSLKAVEQRHAVPDPTNGSISLIVEEKGGSIGVHGQGCPQQSCASFAALLREVELQGAGLHLKTPSPRQTEAKHATEKRSVLEIAGDSPPTTGCDKGGPRRPLGLTKRLKTTSCSAAGNLIDLSNLPDDDGQDPPSPTEKESQLDETNSDGNIAQDSAKPITLADSCAGRTKRGDQVQLTIAKRFRDGLEQSLGELCALRGDLDRALANTRGDYLSFSRFIASGGRIRDQIQATINEATDFLTQPAVLLEGLLERSAVRTLSQAARELHAENAASLVEVANKFPLQKLPYIAWDHTGNGCHVLGVGPLTLTLQLLCQAQALSVDGTFEVTPSSTGKEWQLVTVHGHIVDESSLTVRDSFVGAAFLVSRRDTNAYMTLLFFLKSKGVLPRYLSASPSMTMVG